MNWSRRTGMLTTGTVLTVVAAMSAGGAALAAPSGHPVRTMNPPLRLKVIGRLPNGKAKLTSSSPIGLSPAAIQSVYSLSGLSPSSGAGAGQVIAIVDAYHDPHALSDLNTFNAQYGYAQLSTCTSLSQTGPCFLQADPQGTPQVNSGWVVEESLDIEWAHAEAPAAKIVLVEAASNSGTNLFNAVSYANSIGATEVSMSWAGGEFSGETAYDADMTHPGTFYTASSGDGGHGALNPASSPNVIAVGGTTLNGCSGTSCSGFTSETAWPGSGGGASAFEAIPGYQSGYAGPVFGASTISGLTGGLRGIPDVSFDADPNTGVSGYDSTRMRGQSGWFAAGGTSVGAPNWAGILAAGAAAGKTALQGHSAIYSGGYATNLRDITSGTNGTCGTDCTAGTGYDLVTGLGSPVNYP
jgi:subtilase family serine protease